eukprot:13453691-Alexandrium_andersonii.AAC.1
MIRSRDGGETPPGSSSPGDSNPGPWCSLATQAFVWRPRVTPQSATGPRARRALAARPSTACWRRPG